MDKGLFDTPHIAPQNMKMFPNPKHTLVSSIGCNSISAFLSKEHLL